METVNNLASAASRAIWGESNGNDTPTTETSKNETGDVKAGEPCDKGNLNLAGHVEPTSTPANDEPVATNTATLPSRPAVKEGPSSAEENNVDPASQPQDTQKLQGADRPTEMPSNADERFAAAKAEAYEAAKNDGRRRSAAVKEQLLALERDLRIESSHEAPGDDGNTIERLGSGGNGESSGVEELQITRPWTQAITRRQLQELQEHYQHDSQLQVLGDMFRLPLNEDGAVGAADDDVKAELYAALRAGNPHAVFNVLSDHAKLIGFSISPARSVLVSMPPTTFSEVLRSLDPEHFVGRY